MLTTEPAIRRIVVNTLGMPLVLTQLIVEYLLPKDFGFETSKWWDDFVISTKHDLRQKGLLCNEELDELDEMFWRA